MNKGRFAYVILSVVLVSALLNATPVYAESWWPQGTTEKKAPPPPPQAPSNSSDVNWLVVLVNSIIIW